MIEVVNLKSKVPLVREPVTFHAGHMGQLLYINQEARDYGIERASKDPDLMAFYELQAGRETKAVPDEKAEILRSYDKKQLHQEVQDDYALTDVEFARALRKCWRHLFEDIPSRGQN